MTRQINPPNETINVSTDQNICWITLNRPKSLNALTPDLATALSYVTAEIAKSIDIRAVVLTGEGDHFMAGGDIKKFKTMITKANDKTQLHREFQTLIKKFHNVIINMQSLPQPILASVKGAVAGAGVSLMAACDLVVAGESSFFTLAYCHLGVSPDGGSTHFLPRIVGLKRSFEIALLGERFDVNTAEKWGLINKVVSDNDLLEVTKNLATRLALGPSQAHSRAKALLYGSSRKSLREQLNHEAKAFADCTITKDFEEGVDAFLAKRVPKFTGK